MGTQALQKEAVQSKKETEALKKEAERSKKETENLKKEAATLRKEANALKKETEEHVQALEKRLATMQEELVQSITKDISSRIPETTKSQTGIDNNIRQWVLAEIKQKIEYHLFEDSTGEPDWLQYVVAHSGHYTKPLSYQERWILYGDTERAGVVLQKTHKPGDCWGMDGDKGYVTFQLHEPKKINTC